MSKKIVTAAVAIPVAYIVGFVLLIRSVDVDTTAVVAVLGALAGALGAVVVAPMTALVSVWSKHAESREQVRDRASAHALELTKMDYELRLRALSQSGGTGDFLAPAKVYRELYRALLSLQERDEWPRVIEELGLLGVFRFDAASLDRRKRRDQQRELLQGFLGTPTSNLNTLLHSGNFHDEDGRRRLVEPIHDWVTKNGPKLPPEVQAPLNALANIAGSSISEAGLRLLQNDLAATISAKIEEVQRFTARLAAEPDEDV